MSLIRRVIMTAKFLAANWFMLRREIPYVMMTIGKKWDIDEVIGLCGCERRLRFEVLESIT